jgi:hypothetical protein
MAEKLPTVERNPTPVHPEQGIPAQLAPTYVPPGYVLAVVPQPSAEAPPLIESQAIVPQPEHHAMQAPLEEHLEKIEPEVLLVSHSSLFYWWPVWVVGYLMALLTLMYGVPKTLGQFSINIHPSNNLGVFFFLTLFLVILISNVIVRGLASALVIMGMVLNSSSQGS